MEKHLSQGIRVAINKGNPSVQRIEEKCVKCGACAKICNDYVSVNNNYSLEKTCGNAVCVNCGQCIKVCPTDSLVVAEEYKQVQSAINNKKIVIVNTSPSVRVALGEEFGMPFGSLVQGKMVALLKKLGFSYVLDTNFAADLTICEEASELISRITKGDKPLPQFTSCCPAWIKFAETFYPNILDNISTCKSPIGMQGPIVKTYFAQKMGIDPKDIVNVALTPCVAKKFEIRREEMNISGKVNGVSGMRDMDYCITTTELAKWAKELGINLNKLEDANFDDFMGEASGAAAIFGNTGGVMEAAVRTAYSYLTGKEPTELTLNLQPVRGLDGIRQAEIDISGTKIKVAVVYGLANTRILLDKIAAGEQYHFVEIMTCPGGCIGGGGQPKHFAEDVEAQKARIASLYRLDNSLSVRASHKNPQIIALYKDYLGSTNSELAHKLLHTIYYSRSADLGQQNIAVQKVKMIKYHCLVCGAEFELPEGEPAVCPMCGLDGDALEIIGTREV